MVKTKIICTIGPASAEVETLKKMINAGMDMARINFSHGSYPQQEKFINAVKQAREEVNKPVALLLDMQGPEIRTGPITNYPVTLNEGDRFILYNDDIDGSINGVSVSYKNLYQDVNVGSRILLDDGLIGLEVEEIKDKDIYCKITNGGSLGNRKSINVPGCSTKLPSLKEKDIQDLKDGVKADFDYVAASFVRNAQDALDVRKVLDDNGGEKIKLIAKIENQEGIDNFDEILKVVDGIMIARGDLGVEIPLEHVPIVQKRFIKACNRAGKLVITATQMLESMSNNPRPTRAEVSDVANAIFDGTGAIMLSGESAMGKYPVECVETMDKIAEEIEKSVNYWKRFKRREYDLEGFSDEWKLNFSVCDTALNLRAKAIIAYTRTGDTPCLLSSLLPECPIIAVTEYEKTYRQLAPVWGVEPILMEKQDVVEDVLKDGINKLMQDGKLKKGDLIILSGGPGIDIESSEDGINMMIGRAVRL